MPRNALLVVHGWCTETIASLGNAAALDLVVQELAELVRGDEIVSGHLRADQRKLQNVARDPRIALSIEGTEIHPRGLKEYLVVHGRARLVEGGAAGLLQRLAYVYLGPGVKFPPMDDPPPGHVMHIEVERIGGVGPWVER